MFGVADRQYLDQNVVLRIKPLRIGNTSLRIENAKLVGQESITDFSASKLNFFVVPKITKSVLMQNYPNPFNPETWIPFSIKDPTTVQIHIYDATGHQRFHVLLIKLFGCVDWKCKKCSEKITVLTNINNTMHY